MPQVIKAVDPTIFLKDSGGAMQRLVTVTLELGAAANCTLIAKGPGIDQRIDLGKVPPGESVHDCMLPDSRQSGTLGMALECDGSAAHQLETPWTPARHWRVSFIQFSHHDWGYTSLPSDTVRQHASGLDDVLTYCQRTEDWPKEHRFHYMCEQAWSVVPWLESRPRSVIDQFIHYVGKGQIEVPALWGNQTSELCGHEELARLMYPSFKLKRDYGVQVVSALHNDIPGFSWGLISAMANAGVKYFSMGVPSWYFEDGRPCWDQERFLSLEAPGPFLWEGPDGQRLYSFYMLHGMRNAVDPWFTPYESLAAQLGEFERRGYGYDNIPLMVNGGLGDNCPPSMHYAEMARSWSRQWAYPELVNATLAESMQAVHEEADGRLPVFRGEFPSTDYTACSTCTPKETAVNRNAHNLLMTAEKFATVSGLSAEYEFPRAVIDEAYRNTLNFDLHCWGMGDCGGLSMDASWDEKRGAATRAAALADDIAVKAINHIAQKIDYPQDSLYVTVFNPLAWRRSDIVRLPFTSWSPATGLPYASDPDSKVQMAQVLGREPTGADFDMPTKRFDLIDETTGAKVPYQLSRVTDRLDPRPWSAERLSLHRKWPRAGYDLVFLASDVPSLGYKTYRIVMSTEDRPAAAPETFDGTVETDLFLLKLDPATGSVTSLVDKRTGRELVDDDADHGFGALISRGAGTGHENDCHVDEAVLLDAGPVFTTVRIKGRTEGVPEFARDIVLYHQTDRIDVSARLLRNSEPNLELYFAFPFKAESPEFHFEASGSVVEPLVDQLPGSNTDYYAIQNWAHLADGECGVVWTPIDNHMAEFGGLWPGCVSSAHHGLRGPNYGHAYRQPGEMKTGHIYSLIMYSNYQTNFINVQPSEFMCRYSFRPVSGDWRAEEVRRHGWATTNPLLGVWMRGPQPGELPQQNTFASTDASNVILLTIKPAEDGCGHIVRLIETTGQAGDVTVSLPHLQFSSVIQTNLVEEDLAPAECGDGTFTFRAEPFRYHTIRLLGSE